MKKHIILTGDFNVDFLKYITDISTAQFLDQMYSSSLYREITSPTRISTKSKTLIDNIFFTDSPEELISGNIITSISDRLAQSLLFPIEKTKGSKKKEIYKRNFKSLTGEESIEDYLGKAKQYELIMQITFYNNNFGKISQIYRTIHFHMIKLLS